MLGEALIAFMLLLCA